MIKKTKLSILLSGVLCFLFLAESCAEGGKKVFKVDNPNYDISPCTGVTRQNWVDASEYILEGAFSYIQNMDDAMKFPKQPGKSYPHDERRVPTEKLEGLCRTLFVAAPLLKEKPDLVLNGINVGEYYRRQIVKLTDSTSASYIPLRGRRGPTQDLVEFGALAISLFTVPEVIWDPLSQEDKDALAKLMISYGDGPTIDSNWKFFNIFVLSFFKSQGYEVNEDLLVKYLNKSLDHYREDGWYNDSPAYDYYSMWAFQLYGVVWSEVFGKKYYPEIADKFLGNFQDLENHYPYLFSKEGKMTMYGRSISYRMASVAPFPFMGKYGSNNVNLGWMRKIASTTLMQFLTHPDFMNDNVPTLGFYGAFEPAVQVYSCRGSVFWMGKVFLGLMLPKDDPFWTAKENDGPWADYKNDEVINHFAKKSEILITNYPEIGASEIRAWCHEKVADDWQKFRSTENYNRLAYNSNFPWQADGKNGEVAMNYAIKNAKSEWEVLRLYDFQKFEDGAYYRNAVLETNEDIKFNLVDIPLPNGILRVDKLSAPLDLEMHLGHYALPEFDKPITTVRKKGATIIDNGEYQLAMIPVQGWDGTEVMHTDNLHPESAKSAVIDAEGKYATSDGSTVYITLMLWKNAGEKWSKKDLMPIKKVNVSDDKNSVEITFKSGATKTIDFKKKQ